jgi:hypothetical protein
MNAIMQQSDETPAHATAARIVAILRFMASPFA